MVEPSGSGDEERRFRILLEEVKGEVKVFGEQVSSLSERIDRMAGNVDSRLAALDTKIDLHTRTILAKIDAHKRSHGNQ